jgi:hypothetical protein
MGDTVSKSWFCVFNNPEEHGYTGTPQEITDKLVEVWLDSEPQRTCAVIYCISSEGLPHCHAVFEDTKAMRFSAIKKLYPAMHIEPTKGNKEQAEDYINKRGKWEEKGEQIICISRFGEIKGCQGQRRDLSIIEDMIDEGMNPNQIFDKSIYFRRYEKMVRDAYYRKRMLETPIRRKINVYWHVGETGCGKSYEYVKLAEQYGEDNVYMVSEYEHGFDKYSGEPIVILDEFRGQMRYSQLLVLLDGYKIQVPCRYSNCYGLWTEVHITSVLPPEKVYHKMVSEDKELDTIEQLKRRINFVVFHYKAKGEYYKTEILMSEYRDYDWLKKTIEIGLGVTGEDELPF